MASPRVFVSSTCYDLSQVRDSLVDFIKTYGFEPVLSERGDVFYHPDIHTHDSCINEVGNCHMFILIIGGRFGGTYVADPKKSVVNAEYSAAREQKVPVFTFVRSNVYSDHHVYLKNKQNRSLSDIVFPSIEKQEQAISIFQFIDDVRLSKVNNGLFSFDYAREIINLLRKQWAGMFYDFLEQRLASNQLKIATNLLHNISIAGEKVEELVKGLYRHVDQSGAEAKIAVVEQRATARAFFEAAIDQFAREQFEIKSIPGFLDTPREGKWYEYIANATGGKIGMHTFKNDKNEPMCYTTIDWDSGGQFVDCEQDSENEASKLCREQEARYSIIKEMKDSELKKVLKELHLLKDG